MSDSNVEAVKRKYDERAARGFQKYGVTTDRGDLSLTEWLTHLQEELMDATIYIQKYISEVSDE